jgi:hypothetical protein
MDVGADMAPHREVADTHAAGRGAVLSMALCVMVLIASEFMPVSLLTPIASDLRMTEGLAGQAISISGIFAVLTSLLLAFRQAERPAGRSPQRRDQRGSESATANHLPHDDVDRRASECRSMDAASSRHQCRAATWPLRHHGGSVRRGCVSGRYWHHRRPQVPAREVSDARFQDERSGSSPH